MHDKVVRRRRAVLGLLVVVSLILLTAYFGESPASPLHSVQRGIVQVLSPVQAGASKVLSPVRDVANWVSDTLRAKTQRDQLRKELNAANAKLALLETAQAQNTQLAKQLRLDQNLGVSNYHPVAANVIERDPSLWSQHVMVDKGSGDGVEVGDPVLGDGALVGDVTAVTPSLAVVTLITDHTLAVTANVVDGRNDDGLVSPSVGNPNQLLLQDLPGDAPIQVGQQVVTAGWKDGTLTSLYPAGIPIGTVSRVNQNELFNNNEVSVSPAADLRHFSSVQVLTSPNAGNIRAQVPAG